MFTVALVDAITVTHADTSPFPYKLGSITCIVDPDYGLRFYRYVYNNSGASIAANLGVMQENGTTPYEVSLSGAGIAAQRIYGVTTHAIADNYAGWVGCSGLFFLASDGSTTADTPQKPVANGQFSDGTVGTDTIAAHSLETENPAGAAGLFLALIRFL